MSAICLTTAASPWLALPELIPVLAEADYAGVEIGLKDGAFDPARPVGFWDNNAALLRWDTALAEAVELRQLLDRYDLRCAGLGAYVEAGSQPQIEVALQVAEVLQAGFVRVRAPWYRPGADFPSLLHEARDSYAQLAEHPGTEHHPALIELHDNSICASASGAMRVLEGLDPQRVGVILDPGNYAREGLENIPMVLDLLGPYLHHVHVKNSSIRTSDTTNKHGLRTEGPHAPLAEGIVDWPALVRRLHESGYRGWYSLENFTGLERGPQRLTEDRAWLAGLLAEASRAANE